MIRSSLHRTMQRLRRWAANRRFVKGIHVTQRMIWNEEQKGRDALERDRKKLRRLFGDKS